MVTLTPAAAKPRHWHFGKLHISRWPSYRAFGVTMRRRWKVAWF